jgi:hypothetical protein
LLGDLETDDDPSWATDARETMKQRDRGKGRKEIDALDPDEQFDVVALSLMLEPPASCGVCLCKGYDCEVMTRGQYKITRCNIQQTGFQSSQHDFQCNVNNTPSPHT